MLLLLSAGSDRIVSTVDVVFLISAGLAGVQRRRGRVVPAVFVFGRVEADLLAALDGQRVAQLDTPVPALDHGLGL